MKSKSIECKLLTYSSEIDSNLMKVKLIVMHEGKNFNGSAFSFEGMIDAEPTIKNIPILAYTVVDDEGEVEDFDGHNMETDLIVGENGYELRTTYLEKPIGVIPESCNPRYEVIEGKRHFVVDGYIWRSYSNGSYKLIEDNEFKCVSMEIRVEDGEFDKDTDIYNINKYRYEGVTCLGDFVPPAMGDTCRVMKYSSNNIYKEMLEGIYKEIYRLESEVRRVEKEITTTEFEETKNKKRLEDETEVEVKEDVDVPELPDGGDEESNLETPNSEDKENELTTPEKNETEDGSEVSKDNNPETPNGEGNNLENQEPTDEVANEETSDSEEFETKDDEEVEEDFKKKKCSVEEYSLEIFKVFFEEVPETLEDVCNVLVEKFNSMNEELNSLRAFKQECDNTMLIEEIISIVEEFSFEEEEIKEIYEKAVNKEITVEQFKKELFALEGMKVHNAKKNFSKDNQEKTNVKINVVSDVEKINEPYGGLFAKYGK